MYTLAFLTSFLYIGIKVFQQLNVQHRLYHLMVGTSFVMAVCEAVIVVAQTKHGFHWPTVCAVGLGAGLGSVAGTWMHHRYLEKK